MSEDFVFADPLHFHVGRDALEDNVRTLRSDKPAYRFRIASELDVQHDCYRYEWHMMSRHRVLMRGFDVARLSGDQLQRVDGFFGPLLPLAATGSGIPEELRVPVEARS